MNHAFYRTNLTASSSGGVAAPPRHPGDAPKLVVHQLLKMMDRFQVMDAGDGRWQFMFPTFLDRLMSVPLSPLANTAPSLFLDPFWRRGPETLLREAFQQRSAIFVLGAGVSMAVCPQSPSWKELIRRAADRLAPAQREGVLAELQQPGTDLVSVASRVQTLLSTTDFGAFLKKQFEF